MKFKIPDVKITSYAVHPLDENLILSTSSGYLKIYTSEGIDTENEQKVRI